MTPAIDPLLRCCKCSSFGRWHILRCQWIFIVKGVFDFFIATPFLFVTYHRETRVWWIGMGPRWIFEAPTGTNSIYLVNWTSRQHRKKSIPIVRILS